MVKKCTVKVYRANSKKPVAVLNMTGAELEERARMQNCSVPVLQIHIMEALRVHYAGNRVEFTQHLA